MSDLDPVARAWPYQAVVAFGSAPLHGLAALAGVALLTVPEALELEPATEPLILLFGVVLTGASAVALLAALFTLAPVLLGHRPGRASLPWLARAWWASAAYWTVVVCGGAVLAALGASA